MNTTFFSVITAIAAIPPKVSGRIGAVISLALFIGLSAYLKPLWSFTHISGYGVTLLAALPFVMLRRNERLTNAYFIAYILFICTAGFSGALTEQSQTPW